MTDVKVGLTSFKRNPDIRPDLNFENIIGLYYSNNIREKIILKFTYRQGQYIKTLPLHFSQITLKEDADYTWIQLKIQANYELKQRILFYTPDVEIIEPEWLRKEIIQDLKNGLENYI
jgi:proteasome accessory factor B